MPLGKEVNLGPVDIVLDGNPAPQRGTAPRPMFGSCLLWPHGGCIKMLIGIDVGLIPEDFVLDGDPVPLPEKGAEPPIFDPCLL